MSLEMLGHIGDSGDYRVEDRFGCRIIWGTIPMTDLIALSSNQSEDTIMSIHLSNLIGAAFVFGTKENLKAMEEDSNLPISKKRLMEAARARRQGYPRAFEEWLAKGHRGQSSDAIAQQVTGVIHGNKLTNHPHDADDFSRCIDVVRSMVSSTLSETEIVSQIAGISPVWRGISLEWSSLKNLFLSDTKGCSEKLKEIAKEELQ